MHIDPADGYAVAQQLASTQQAVDAAIKEIACLMSSILEIGTKAALAPATTQPALHELATALTLQVDARHKLIATRKRLVAIKDRSNLKEVDFGCLGDGSLFGDSGLRVVANAG